MALYISTLYYRQLDQSDGLVQNCSNPRALAIELLQSCTKPSKCFCSETQKSCNWRQMDMYSQKREKGMEVTICYQVFGISGNTHKQQRT